MHFESAEASPEFYRVYAALHESPSGKWERRAAKAKEAEVKQGRRKK